MELVWIESYLNHQGKIGCFGIYRKLCRHCNKPFYVTGSMNPEAKKNGNFGLVNCENHRGSKVLFGGTNTTINDGRLSTNDLGGNLAT
jgi:hypothetical protein